jgi:uncharacterized protein
VGEAVTSMLQKKGVPGVVERTLIRPPSSQLGPITPDQRAQVMQASAMAGKYDETLDRASAFEMLRERAARAAREAEAAEGAVAEQEEADREFRNARRWDGGCGSARSASRSTRRKTDDTFGGAITTAVIKELKGTTGRRIVRGILGGLFKGR